jgi:uncharacterized membrane protein YraQ (UPF0718 family)
LSNSFLVMLAAYGLLVAASYYYAFKQDKGKAKKSISKGWKQFLNQLPLLIAIFLLIGIFDKFVPKSIVVNFIGKGKGFASVLRASVLGSIIMGPVSSEYPFGAVLLQKGATIAATAVFLDAWVMVGVITLPFEISVFGKKFALLRNILAFVGAIIIGMITGLLIVGSAF